MGQCIIVFTICGDCGGDVGRGVGIIGGGGGGGGGVSGFFDGVDAWWG